MNTDDMTPERKAAYEHGMRRAARARELMKLTKAQLLVRYTALGGLGGKYPPHTWRKDEIVTSVWEMEERAAGRNPYPNFSEGEA